VDGMRKGVKVTGNIVPANELDEYATNIDIFGKGGVHSVELITDRDAITILRRSEGMLCYVKEDNSIYTLLEGIENTDWKKLYYLENGKVVFNFGLLQHYILLGNKDGEAEKSLSFKDAKQDIIDLRRAIDLIKSNGVVSEINVRRGLTEDTTTVDGQTVTEIGLADVIVPGVYVYPEAILMDSTGQVLAILEGEQGVVSITEGANIVITPTGSGRYIISVQSDPTFDYAVVNNNLTATTANVQNVNVSSKLDARNALLTYISQGGTLPGVVAFKGGIRVNTATGYLEYSAVDGVWISVGIGGGVTVNELTGAVIGNAVGNIINTALNQTQVMVGDSLTFDWTNSNYGQIRHRLNAALTSSYRQDTVEVGDTPGLDFRAWTFFTAPGNVDSVNPSFTIYYQHYTATNNFFSQVLTISYDALQARMKFGVDGILDMRQNKIAFLKDAVDPQDGLNLRTGKKIQATKSFLMATRSGNYTGNLNYGDHIQFNSIISSQGTNIKLDTTSPYSNVQDGNVPSIGRITLEVGFLYKFTAYVGYFDGASPGFVWYVLNSGGGGTNAYSSYARNNGTAVMYIDLRSTGQFFISALYELQINGSTISFVNGHNRNCTILIEEI